MIGSGGCIRGAANETSWCLAALLAARKLKVCQSIQIAELFPTLGQQYSTSLISIPDRDRLTRCCLNVLNINTGTVSFDIECEMKELTHESLLHLIIK